jgi:6,7-dimethyl-8-ribityllumazine synthase
MVGITGSEHTSAVLSEAHQEAVKGARLLIVEGRFYQGIGDDLLKGAKEAATAAQTSFEVITVLGALEIPPMVMMALHAAENAGTPYDAVIALGCVIRGETGHYDIVAGESARALMDLSVALGMPLGNAILTVETHEQATARAYEKGKGAVVAALTVLAYKRQLSVMSE